MNFKKIINENVELAEDAELLVKSGHCMLKEDSKSKLKLDLG